MKTNQHPVVCLLLTVTLLTGLALSAATTSELLQEGLYAEEVEGNIDSAIDSYRQVIQDRSAPPSHVARALYRQAMCYIKIRDEASAQAALQRLVADYPNETELVEKARPVLHELADFDPALLMPANTLLYMELGSPGEQIESILEILKGTPFENPLLAIGDRPGENSTEKSPNDILAALLNPSMMAEFKKIRGSAVGITGIGPRHPQTITVLYPGKSDALRGIIQAALGVAGTPGRAIEGMQRMNLPEDVAVAYDDNVVIAAQPMSQLEWCVKQYKGILSEPTLATANPAFAKLNKNLRRKNTVTIWAKVDEAYARVLELFPDDQIPPELVSANAFVDFANIDELIWMDSLDPTGVSSKIKIQFKDGHQSLAYDLIRTPNITVPALKAVPSEAIALASFSLNEADTGQSRNVRSIIQKATGLDVGREIFNNLEQITLFAMPAPNSTPGDAAALPLPGQFGLVMTSRDPDQTQQVLDLLLNALSGGHPDSPPGCYRIGGHYGADLHCYMQQANGVTLLSMNPTINEAAVAALTSGRSVTTSGALNEAVDSLASNASKLMLVNAGGAIRLLGPQLTPENLSEEQLQQFNTGLNELARAADGTTLEIRTDEEENSFNFNASVEGIPPLHEVFDPVTKIAFIVEQANAGAQAEVEAEAMAQAQAQKPPALIFPTTQAPVIDGKEDEVWSRAPRNKIGNVMSSFAGGEKASPPASADDLSAEFRAMWDEDCLYLLVDVTDDQLVNDTSPDQSVTLSSGLDVMAWWYDDSVEVYIDADNAKPDQYGEKDAHYHFDWHRRRPTMGVQNLTHDVRVHNQRDSIDGVEFAMRNTDKGYRTEIKFPWAKLGTKPSAGATIGLDVHVNDDDDGNERDCKITWHDEHDTAWQNPQSFGTGLLGGLVGWWKFDETEGRTAEDSSGGNRHGTLKGGAKWASGKRGGAIELDGSQSFVRIQDKTGFDMADQMTIACWVNLGTDQPHRAIVTKGDDSWRLSTAGSGARLHTSVDKWERVKLDGTTEMPMGQWHHAVAVYDGERLCLYLDGQIDGMKGWTGPIARNNHEVFIGNNADQANRFFTGLIDDVRVYNYALSENEVRALGTEP